MHACTPVCTHVYTYVYMHVHAHFCTHVYSHAHARACTHFHTHVYTHVHADVYTHAYAHAYTDVCKGDYLFFRIEPLETRQNCFQRNASRLSTAARAGFFLFWSSAPQREAGFVAVEPQILNRKPRKS